VYLLQGLLVLILAFAVLYAMARFPM
jgi:hypothetical protein